MVYLIERFGKVKVNAIDVSSAGEDHAPLLMSREEVRSSGPSSDETVLIGVEESRCVQVVTQEVNEKFPLSGRVLQDLRHGSIITHVLFGSLLEDWCDDSLPK